MWLRHVAVASVPNEEPSRQGGLGPQRGTELRHNGGACLSPLFLAFLPFVHRAGSLRLWRVLLFVATRRRCFYRYTTAGFDCAAARGGCVGARVQTARCGPGRPALHVVSLCRWCGPHRMSSVRSSSDEPDEPVHEPPTVAC